MNYQRAKKTILWVMSISLLAGCASGPDEGTGKERKLVPIYSGTGIGSSNQKSDDVDAANTGSGFQRAEYILNEPSFPERQPLRPVEYFGNGTTTLSFINTDIRIILSAVLRDTLGLNYFADPRVQGVASLESNGPVSKDALFSALEVLLKTKGFALVESSDGLVVLPLADAPQRVKTLSAKAPASSNLPTFGVQIVPLKHVSATEMASLVEPFAPQDAILRSDNIRNILILAGTSRELTSLANTISTFDVDWMSNMSFGIFSFRYAEATQIEEELKEIFDVEGSPTNGLIRFIPIPRINKLLAIAPRQSHLKDVEQWISKLDAGEGSPGRRIYIYPVKHGRAVDLAQMLNQILGTGYGGFNGGGLNSNSSVNRANSGNNRLNKRQGVRNGSSALDGDQIRIVPNEENNSLVILAMPSEFGVVENALKQVDVAPQQVLIEVTLAEITLTDELRYGVQWSFEFGDNAVAFAKSATPTAEFPGFSWSYTNQTSASAVLNAIESMTDVQVISSPKLMVLNNQSASIQVGDEVPVPTSSAISTNDGDAPIVNTIQYRSTGVILTVTPRINEGGLVMMDVVQEVSSVVETASSGIDAPTIQSRKISSSIAAQNGTTIALGGLIRRTISNTRSGVPVLKDVPLLGKLFSENDDVERRSELIVLITPRIIGNVDEQQEVMDYLQKQFKSLVAPDLPVETQAEDEVAF